MFWVIFDTSTVSDYYRDVHNVLAMPPGSIYRYDYKEKYFSPSALQEIQPRRAGEKVLLVYAQANTYQKGGNPPTGAIPFGEGLWVGTRLATLKNISFSVDRYFLDLQLEGYPAPNAEALNAILLPLVEADEVPFSKWVATSALNEPYQALCEGTHPENWAAIVNKLGTQPAQFAGDSFWRIRRIAAGDPAVAIPPEVEERRFDGSSKATAFFPVNELTRLTIEIDARLPQVESELPAGETGPRSIAISATGDSLAAFTGKSQPLRRYQDLHVDGEVASTDRLSAQDCKLHFSTGPTPANQFPIGPEFALDLRVSMAPWRRYIGVLTGVLAASLVFMGAGLMRGHVEWGTISIVSGVLLGVIAYSVLTGRVKLPGAK